MKNNAYQILNKTISLLNKKQKVKLLILTFLSFVSATLDFIAVISVYPFINIILDENSIKSNSNYFKLWKTFGSPEINDFILYISLVVIFIIVISSSFNYYTQYLSNMFSSEIQISIGSKIYKNITYVNYEWHLSKNSIKLMNIFTANLTKLSKNIIRQIPLLVGYFSILIIPSISLIILSNQLNQFVLNQDFHEHISDIIF